MGSFANSVFNLLLGWLRAAVQSLWSLIAGDGGNLLTWLGENWLALTIAVCCVCTLIDVLVHLIRWRPYKVWASFLRRITGQEKRQQRREAHERRQQQEPRAEAQEWVYQPPEPVEEPVQPAAQTLPEDQEAYRSRFARPEAQRMEYQQTPEMERLHYQAIRRDELPAPQGLTDYPQPAVAEEAQPVAGQQIHPAAEEVLPRESLSTQMRRRMSQLQKNLGITEDESDMLYRPAQPIVDKNEMYHAPVYPPERQTPPHLASGTPETDAVSAGNQQPTPRRRRQHRDIGRNA